MYNVLQQKKACLGKTFPFRTKKTSEKRIFEVFTSALEHFRNLLCNTKDNQTDKNTVPLEAQGVESK